MTQIYGHEWKKYKVLVIDSSLFSVILLHKFFYKASWRYFREKSACERRFYRSDRLLGIFREWLLEMSELLKAKKKFKKKSLNYRLVYFRSLRWLWSRTHLQHPVAVFNIDCLIPDADEIVKDVRSLSVWEQAVKSCVKVLMNIYVTCVPYPPALPAKLIHSIHLPTDKWIN